MDGDQGNVYLTLHSIIVPLLSTPNWVYMGFCGFCISSQRVGKALDEVSRVVTFFTDMMGS